MPEVVEPAVRSKFLRIAGLPARDPQEVISEQEMVGVGKWDSFLASGKRELSYVRDFLTPTAPPTVRPLGFDPRNVPSFAHYDTLPTEVGEKVRNRLMQADSPEEYSAIEAEVQNDIRLQRMAAENPWSAAGGAVAFSLGDPTTLLIPWGKVGRVAAGVRSGKRMFDIAESGAKLGLAAAATTVLSEALNQASDATRTRDESIANVMGALIFGGALGGGIKSYQVGRLNKASSMIVDAVREGVIPAGNLPLSIQMLLKLSGDGGVAGKTSKEAAEMMAQVIQGTAREINLPAKTKLDKLARFFYRMSPVGRTLRSRVPIVRYLGTLLSDSPVVTDNPGGVAIGHAVETLQQVKQARYARDVALPLDAAWEKYLDENPGNREFGGMIGRRKAFNEAVGRARVLGESDLTDPGARAAVQEAVKIIDGWLDKSIGPETVRTGQREMWEAVEGEPYWHRDWNHKELTTRREEFRLMLVRKRMEAGLDKDVAERAADENIANLLGGPGGKKRPLDSVREAGHNIERTLLDIPTRDLIPWLNMDVTEVLPEMSRQHAGRTALIDTLKPITQLPEMDDLPVRAETAARRSDIARDDASDFLEYTQDLHAAQRLKANRADDNAEVTFRSALEEKEAARRAIRAAEADGERIQSEMTDLADSRAKNDAILEKVSAGYERVPTSVRRLFAEEYERENFPNDVARLEAEVAARDKLGKVQKRLERAAKRLEGRVRREPVAFRAFERARESFKKASGRMEKLGRRILRTQERLANDAELSATDARRALAPEKRAKLERMIDSDIAQLRRHYDIARKLLKSIERRTREANIRPEGTPKASALAEPSVSNLEARQGLAERITKGQEVLDRNAKLIGQRRYSEARRVQADLGAFVREIGSLRKEVAELKTDAIRKMHDNFTNARSGRAALSFRAQMQEVSEEIGKKNILIDKLREKQRVTFDEIINPTRRPSPAVGAFQQVFEMVSSGASHRKYRATSKALRDYLDVSDAKTAAGTKETGSVRRNWIQKAADSYRANLPGEVEGAVTKQEMLREIDAKLAEHRRKFDAANEILAKQRAKANKYAPEVGRKYIVPEDGEKLGKQIRLAVQSLRSGAAQDAYNLKPFLADDGIINRHFEARKKHVLKTMRASRKPGAPQAEVGKARRAVRKELASIEKERQQVLRDIGWMRDQITDNVGQVPGARMASNLAKMNFFRLMGDFALSNAYELFGTTQRTGARTAVTSALHSLFGEDALRNLKAAFIDYGIRGRSPRTLLQKAREEEALVDLVMAMDMAGGDLSRSNALYAIQEATGDRLLDKIIHVPYRISRRAFGTDPMTAFTRGANARAVLSSIYRDGRRYLSDPERYKDLEKVFQSWRLDPADLPEIIRFYEEFGDLRGALKVPRTQDWRGPGAERAREKLELALFNAVNQSTIRASVGDRPAFTANPFAALWRQFTGFLSAAHNRIFIPGLQLRDRRAAEMIALQLSVALFQEAARSALTGRELPDNAQDWGRRLSRRVSFLGYPGMIGEITDRVFGRSIESRFNEDVQPMSNMELAGAASSAALGPTGSTINDALIAGNALISGRHSERSIRATTSFIPARDAWYIDVLLSRIERAAAKSLGLPLMGKKKKRSSSF